MGVPGRAALGRGRGLGRRQARVFCLLGFVIDWARVSLGLGLKLGWVKGKIGFRCNGP